MQEAFWYGVFAHIIQFGELSKAEWYNLLRSLNFHTKGIWQFSWVKGMNGSAASLSKEIGQNVLVECFAAGKLPSAGFNLGDFLKGNDATVTLRFSPTTASGNKSRKGYVDEPFPKGADVSRSVAGRHVAVESKSANVGKVELIDGASFAHQPVFYSPKGFVLNPAVHSNPLQLTIKMYCYGDTSQEAKVRIAW